MHFYFTINVKLTKNKTFKLSKIVQLIYYRIHSIFINKILHSFIQTKEINEGFKLSKNIYQFIFTTT